MADSRAHAPDCPRPEHYGPCHGPLRAEKPETPAEREQRHLEAIEAVLVQRLPAGCDAGDEWLRETAEALLSAAEVGI